MEQTEEIPKHLLELSYPTWKKLLQDLFKSEEFMQTGINMTSHKIQKLINQVGSLRNKHTGFYPDIAVDFIDKSGANYISGDDLSQIQESIERLNLGSNEFHTVYHMPTYQYTYVSEKVEKVLGVKKEDFTAYNVYGNKGKDGLQHPVDNFHVMRWGYLSYIVLATPGFHFRANNDHYLIRHRIKTKKKLNSKSVKDRYVVIEKRCYLCHDSLTSEKFKPTMHLDRWTVLKEDPTSLVRPLFVSEGEQDYIMNSLIYLLNAVLMGVSPKYLILLNERIKADRHKAVAVEVSKKINHYKGFDVDLAEQQVADCFSKTIRQKMFNLINFWEPIPRDSNKHFTDTDIVMAATRLGLIPFSEDIEALIYNGLGLVRKKERGIRY